MMYAVDKAEAVQRAMDTITQQIDAGSVDTPALIEQREALAEVKAGLLASVVVVDD